jgi:predicted MFS family arabinose efflux permease
MKLLTSSNAWYAVWLLAIVNLVNYMDRMALSVLLPAIKTDLRLSDTQLGLLTGFAFAIFYAVFGLPIARWADRGVRRTIISLAMGMWSVMTALSGAAQNFWQLFLARIGVGIGEAGCIPPSHSLISDYVPASRRAGALAVHTAGASIGTIVGVALAGWLSTQIGWRQTFLVLGMPGLLMAAMVRITLKEPPRGFSDGAIHSARDFMPLGPTIRYLWGCRSYVQLVTIQALATLANFGLNQWLPSFYTRTFGMNIAMVGLYFGLAYGVGSTLGALGGGFLANRLSRRDIRRPLRLAAACYAVAVSLGLAIFLAPTATWALGANFLFSMILFIPTGALFALVQSVVPSQMRALASAITMFCASAVGIGAGPFFVGVTSDALAPAFGGESLRYALMIATGFLLWPVFHCRLANKHLKADLAAASSRQFQTPSECLVDLEKLNESESSA